MSALQNFFETQVLPRMALTPGDRVLDLGCGDGWACRLVAAAATQGMVVGIDSSGDAIRTARRESRDYDNILYIEAEAEENPWQDNFFSHALLIDTLESLRDLPATLQHLHRVLSPGGRVWFVGTSADSTASLQEDLAQHGFTVVVSEPQFISAAK